MDETKQCKKHVKGIVPWLNKQEWLKVYHGLFSNSYTECQWALGRIAAWKCKAHPSIPLGIETTAALVSAQLLKNQVSSDHIDSENIRMVYSMAIIRFINFVSDLGQNAARNLAIQAAVDKFNIPNWLVTIRHFATHSTLPSMALLQNGVQFALNWLHENYWEQIVFQEVNLSSSKSDVQAKISEALKLIQTIQCQLLCARGRAKKSFNSRQCREIASLRKLCIANKDVALEVFCLPSLIILTKRNINEIIKSSSDQLLEIPMPLLRHAEPFLRIIFCINGVQVLLNNIIDDVESGSFDEFQINLAYLWVMLICKCLVSPAEVTNEKTLLVQLANKFRHQVDWLKILKVLIRIPDSYVKDFLPTFLSQCKLGLPEHSVEHVIKLFAIYNGHFLSSTDSQNSDDKSAIEETVFDKSDLNFMIENIYSCRSKSPSISVNNGWEVADENVRWSDYSIGILPEELEIKKRDVNDESDIEMEVSSEADGAIIPNDFVHQMSRDEVDINNVLKSIDEYYDVPSST